MVVRLPALKTALAAAIAVAAGLLSASCASAPTISTPSYASQDVERTYRLGIGDKLKIIVFGEENLSGQFEVNALGQVAVPLIGEVTATGRQISQFRDDIARRLANGYLTNPRVTVDVLNYRPIYVHGEVKNGGEFPYKSGIRLRDAIALAGGYTYRANQSYVTVFREGKKEMNVSVTGAFSILPGDNIRVPERFF